MRAVRDVVVAFNNAITTHDLDGLAALMRNDHRFIDSAGHVVSGKVACLEAWRTFFAAFPDYRNHFDSFTVQGSTVSVVGRSSCSVAELCGPARWTADVANGLITRWQVVAL
jgi:ketosteroid isomerase-like protein